MANQLMVVNSGSKNEKKVALTFDDGPNPYATPKILDILKEHNCKATFFFIGRWVEKYPEIVLRARNEGHVIGGHTMYHGGDNRSLPYHEFIKGNSVIEKITGEPVKYIRVPQFGYDKVDGGTSRVVELINELKDKINNKDIIVVGASIIPHDWSMLVPKSLILFNTVSNLHSGAIIDLHDGSEKENELKTRANRTVAILPDIIKNIKNSGYDIVNLDDIDFVFDDLLLK